MFIERERSLRAFHVATDLVALGLAFGLGVWLRAHHAALPLLQAVPSTPWRPQEANRADYALLVLAAAAAWITGLRSGRGHLVALRHGLMRLVAAHARGLIWAVTGVSLVVFAVKVEHVSRLVFGYYFLSGAMLLLAKDVALRALVRRRLARGVGVRRVLLVGAGRPLSWFAQTLLDADHASSRPVGILWADDAEAPEAVAGLPVLGRLADADAILADHAVDEVFVVGGPQRLALLAPLVQSLTERGRVVSVVTTNHSTGDGVRGRVTEFDGIPVLSYGPMPHDEVGASVKRVMDVVIAAVAAILLAPLAAAVALAIAALDPGPLIFGHQRLGRGGELFTLYKFRSMRVDAEGWLRRDPALYERYVANDFKLPEDQDPRVSPLGRWLRRTSLDELPQLWNVLCGDMSLVGPRPIVPAELSHYQPYASMFLAVRPGVTGLWQVSGRSDVRYPERAFLDLDYIGARSVGLDIWILLRTLPAVLLRRGAH